MTRCEFLAETARLESMASGRPYRLLARNGVVVREPTESRPGPSDVHVKVEAATLGSFPSPSPQRPEALGDGFVGRIVEIGEGVGRERLGGRVMGIVRAGAAASDITVPASTVFAVDESVPKEIAAVGLATGITALVIDWSRPVGPGETALVLHETGSAGCLLAGLIRNRGGTAIAWRPSEDGADQLRRAGFGTVFVGTEPPRAEQLRALTGGRLADVVFDASRSDPAPWDYVGSVLEGDGYALRRPRSTATDWDPQRSETLQTVAGVAQQLGGPGIDLVAALERAVGQLISVWKAGELYAPIRLFGAHQAQAAYDALGDRRGLGRIVVAF